MTINTTKILPRMELMKSISQCKTKQPRLGNTGFFVLLSQSIPLCIM